jgi:hypothetical protein
MTQGITDMSATVLVCGKVFDGVCKALTGPAEILMKRNQIAGRCAIR